MNKPRFSKISQVKWYDILETEEHDSSFSSSYENAESSELNGCFATPTSDLRKSNFLVKSPAYWRRSDAETKVKGNILTWFTYKAQSMLEELRRNRRTVSIFKPFLDELLTINESKL